MEAMSVFSDISMEAEAASAKKALRKKIEDYIIKSINLMERTTKVNEKYWKDRFASMSDADFDKFMHCLKDGTENIHMYVPPLKVHLRNADLIDAAHKLGVKLMHRIWMQDETTGLRYLTPEEYLVVQLPVRRQQQFLDEIRVVRTCETVGFKQELEVHEDVLVGKPFLITSGVWEGVRGELVEKDNVSKWTVRIEFCRQFVTTTINPTQFKMIPLDE